MNEKINALVKRLKKGKTRYFDEFYDLTKKAVYFTVFKILGTAAESNDVMQDVYVSFLNRLDDIDENGAYAYLVASAKTRRLTRSGKRSACLRLTKRAISPI